MVLFPINSTCSWLELRNKDRILQIDLWKTHQSVTQATFKLTEVFSTTHSTSRVCLWRRRDRVRDFLYLSAMGVAEIPKQSLGRVSTYSCLYIAYLYCTIKLYNTWKGGLAFFFYTNYLHIWQLFLLNVSECWQWGVVKVVKEVVKAKHWHHKVCISSAWEMCSFTLFHKKQLWVLLESQ